MFEDEDDGSEEEAPPPRAPTMRIEHFTNPRNFFWDSKSTSPVKLSEVSKEEAELAHTRAKGKRTLTSFEQFGRDVVRRYFLARLKGFELALQRNRRRVSATRFWKLLGHQARRPRHSSFLTSLRLLNDLLQKEGTVSCFALCPVDDISFAAVFLANGFRKTGVLQAHVQIGKERKDVILFSRKLANPLADLPGIALAISAFGSHSRRVIRWDALELGACWVHSRRRRRVLFFSVRRWDFIKSLRGEASAKHFGFTAPCLRSRQKMGRSFPPVSKVCLSDGRSKTLSEIPRNGSRRTLVIPTK